MELQSEKRYRRKMAEDEEERSAEASLEGGKGQEWRSLSIRRCLKPSQAEFRLSPRLDLIWTLGFWSLLLCSSSFKLAHALKQMSRATEKYQRQETRQAHRLQGAVLVGSQRLSHFCLRAPY